jgi:hypothetical protein
VGAFQILGIDIHGLMSQSTITDAMDDEEDEEFDLIQRAEAALALPDEHFLEIAAESAPTRNEASAAATLE